jgi:hypothetical protein
MVLFAVTCIEYRAGEYYTKIYGVFTSSEKARQAIQVLVNTQRERILNDPDNSRDPDFQEELELNKVDEESKDDDSSVDEDSEDSEDSDIEKELKDLSRNFKITQIGDLDSDNEFRTHIPCF